jgi:hypothetical protein
MNLDNEDGSGIITDLQVCDPSDTRFHTLQADTNEIETEYYICRVDFWPDGSIMAQVGFSLFCVAIAVHLLSLHCCGFRLFCFSLSSTPPLIECCLW